MKAILHYSLGFPPYRTGGMTKFCIDLMKWQARNGYRVSMLWPGQMGLINRNTTIKDRGIVSNIQSFEIINPLPVSYDEGIREFEAFMADGNKEVYIRFLHNNLPDVIHIHTFMGLHRSLLEAAKELGIRMIFTAHDFFPICPKVTMFRCGQICETVQDCSVCNECNITALSIKKICLLQSPVYRLVKDSAVVRRLRKQHRDAYLSGKTMNEISMAFKTVDYQRLRSFYYSFLKQMDMIHYNSSVTEAVYERFFKLPQSALLSISHEDISDHRKIKHFTEHIRFTYLGAQSVAKGYFCLKAAMDQLWKVKKNFELNVYFEPLETASYIKKHPRYDYSGLETVMDNTDILVVPSLWYETFGYTVLEALSYGVPVIISGNVGAKDILAEGAGIVVNDMDEKKLYKVLNSITTEKLKSMNKLICEKQKVWTLDEIAKELAKRCYICSGSA